MYFIGAYTQNDSPGAGLVIVQKSLKNVKHHFRLAAAWTTAVEGLGNTMTGLYNDPAYIIKKRVFSQDRRPTKDVSAHPVLVMASRSNDTAVCKNLRNQHIPVESILITQSGEVHAEGPKRAGVGRDFRVPAAALADTLHRVLQQGRLTGLADNKETLPTDLQAILSHAAAFSGASSPKDWPPPLTAMAAIVWFRENNRYTRTYRTSSTRLRRFG